VSKRERTLCRSGPYQTMAGGKFETTPLVVDGILYGTGQDDRAVLRSMRKTGSADLAVSARRLPGDIRPCLWACESAGWRFLGDKLFMGTLDAHVIALGPPRRAPICVGT